MALFREVALHADLPKVGQAFEVRDFDMKKAFDKGPKWFERAKDVAAFANAMGGVVLIGAEENAATGALTAYHPVSALEAKEIKDAYDLAVRDRCSPKPVINIFPIEMGPNQSVVAVNVWPFPGQAVGVQVNGDKADGFGGRTHVFPMRVGTQTTFLTPEQLPMLMLPELRRVAILLEQIPNAERGRITVIDGARSSFGVFGLKEVGTVSNVAVLEYKGEQGKAAGGDMGLPLDMITTVWRDPQYGWKVVVKGLVLNGTPPRYVGLEQR